MTFHNPSVSVNALDCHGGLGRKLRWHHQPATVIEQGCVHGGSFPHILAGVKPASWDLFLRLCRARLGPSCRSSWRRAELKPPGNPAANGIKFFAASELLELIKDRAWLVKVTNAVNQRWQRNNASKKNGAAEVLANGQASPTAAG